MSLLKDFIQAEKQAEECKRRVETNFHADLYIAPRSDGRLSLHRQSDAGNRVYETILSTDEAVWLHQQLGRILGL